MNNLNKVFIRKSSILIVLFTLPIFALSQSFIYDNFNRLTEIDYNNGTKITYTYDKLGNRIKQIITAPIACSAPTNLSNTNIIATGARLAWTAVNGATNYTVRYRKNGTSAWTTKSNVSNPYTASGLTGGTTYQWQVQANCPSGATGYSTAKTFTTTCSVPTSLTQSNIAATSMRLSWSSINGATNYTLQYRKTGTTSWTTKTNIARPYTLTNLVDGTSYQWRVRTNCSVGTSGYSSIKTSTTACDKPDGLSSDNITATSARFNWTNVSGATTFTVQYRKTGTSTWTTKSSVTRPYTATGLTAATTYEWRVRRECEDSNSIYVNGSNFTTQSAASCATPTSLSHSNISALTMTLSWSVISGANNYTLQYRKSGTTTWTTKSNIARPYTLSNLISGTSYQWRVRTNCASGNSGYSSVKTTTTACDEPDGLSSSNIAATSARLNWTSVSGATTFTVQYRKIGISTWTTKSSVTRPYTATGLTAATTYEWKIRRECEDNNSIYVNGSNFTTQSTSSSSDPSLISLTSNLLQIQYPSNIKASTANANNITIIGEETGRKNQATYTSSGKIVTIRFNTAFKPGEQIFITTTNNVQNTTNTAFPTYVWIEYAPVTNTTNAVFTAQSTGITLPTEALNFSFQFSNADFNKDGYMDIIARYHAKYGDPTKILIYLQNPNGTFNNPATYTTSRSHSNLRGTPDLNGDGYPDILVSHNVPSSAHIRLNNGDGTFGSEFFYNVSNYSNGIDFGDLDGDGDLDLINKTGIASLSRNNIGILKNNGDGTFAAQTTISTDNGFASQLRLGDLDTDGDLDIIYASSTSFNSTPTFKVYENNGSGNFTKFKSEANPEVVAILPIRDYDNNGQKDMVVEKEGAKIHLNPTGLNYGLSGGISIYLNDQVSLLSGDINGDGAVDLFGQKTDNGTDSYSLPYKNYINNGNGSFAPTTGNLLIKKWSGLKLSDMDSDGDLDQIYVDDDRKIFIAVNGGTTNCVNNITHNVGTINSKTYKAANSIVSKCTIGSNAIVNYQAGQTITLQPGFQTSSGSQFSAIIAPCTLSTVQSEEEAGSRSRPPSEKPQISDQLQLQVVPNPVQQQAKIRFYLPTDNFVSLRVISSTGQQLTEINSRVSKGWNQSFLDATKLDAGFYYILLETRESILTENFIKVK